MKGIKFNSGATRIDIKTPVDISNLDATLYQGAIVQNIDTKLYYSNGQTWSSVSDTSLTSNLANNSTFAYGKTESALNVNSASFAANAEFTYLANNTTFAYGKTEPTLNVNASVFSTNAEFAYIANNTTLAYGKTEVQLNVNSAIIANDSNFLLGYTWNNPGELGSGVSNSANFTDVSISGNLVVTGTTTFVNTAILDVGNSFIIVNSTQVNPFTDMGFVLQRYETANTTNYNVAVAWEENEKIFTIGKTQNTVPTSDISFFQPWLQINEQGNVTVNSASISTLSVNTLIANNSAGSVNQVLSSNGTGVYWSNPLPGYTGSIGYVGSRGFTGSAGYVGSLGSLGYSGSIGFAGSRGYSGSAGFTGSRGFNGSIGYAGSTGYIGSIGATGFVGSEGTVGGNGFAGSAGYVGSLGSLGYTGSLGFTGSRGYTGSIGAVGFGGSIGYIGSLGFTGSEGFTGSIGYTGSIGFVGSKGIPGTSITLLGSSATATDLLTDWPSAIAGNAVFVIDEGDLYIYNDATWDNAGQFIGYVGSIGFTGSIGYAGSRGVTGFIGSLGYSGSASTVPGFVGSSGYAGSAGNASTVPGFVGSRGYTGSVGAASTVPGYIGSIGYAGSKGNAGTSVNILGSVANFADLNPSYAGADGDAYVVTSEGNLYIWYSPAWENVGRFVGFNGSRGFTGSIGYTGSIGFIGSIGYVGSVGFIGSASNAPGFTGSIGFSGSRGFNGSLGYSGSIGFAGSASTVAGFVGSRGFSGSGYAGSRGDVGFVGSRGYVGSIGFVGSASTAPGFTGSRGYAGSVGNSGSSGFVGSKGDLGYTGSIGFDGSRGYTGSIGYTGSVGYIGSVGFTGSSGFVGSASSVAGPTGFTGSLGFVGSIGFTGSVAFTPVQQGGGAGQGTNKVYVGWLGTDLGLQIDSTNFGSSWPITSSKALTLADRANTDRAMTFRWTAQTGQPAWLWGTTNGTDAYVWNPATLNVNSATTANGLNTANSYRVNSFGVGTAASGITGEIRATNEITAYYSSDRRLKENIVPIEGALDKISKIAGVMFDWKDEYIAARGGEDGYFVRKHDTGIIAQEVLEVLPEVVAEREDGTLAVKYEKMMGLVVQAINELKVQLDELKDNK